jgi:hypothetical protein
MFRHSLTKQVIWTAATAFFGSLHLDEILAHSMVSDLTWNDIKASSPTIFIRLKQPKLGEKDEYIDLFPFAMHDCCPVAAQKYLKANRTHRYIKSIMLKYFEFQGTQIVTSIIMLCLIRACMF